MSEKKRIIEAYENSILDEKFKELIKPELKKLFDHAENMVETARTQYGNNYIEGALKSIDVLQKKVLPKIVEILKRHATDKKTGRGV